MSDAAKVVSGEVALVLEGASYVLRPSFAAITACEAQTGLALNDLAVAAYDQRLTVSQAAIVATEMIRAWGGSGIDTPLAKVAAAVSVERIGELIFETGMMTVAPRLAIVLMNALMGGVTASGEPKPPATT